MSGHDLVRAWKDPARLGGDADHPSGEISLGEIARNHVGGNLAVALAATEPLWTAGCGPYDGGCGGLTNDSCLWICTYTVELCPTTVQPGYCSG
jgi:hypothetical protein